MKTFWLIRHAESLSNAGEITRHPNEVFLTIKGEEQAKWLGAHFPAKPTNLYISELPRTKQTATPLADRFNLPMKILPCLNEFDPLGLSIIQGMNGEERAVVYENYWRHSGLNKIHGDDGESFEHLHQRITTFLQLLPDIEDRSAFVGHSVWMKVLAWYLLGFSVSEKREMPIVRKFQHGLPTPNAGVFILYYDEESQETWMRALPDLTPPSARIDKNNLQI